MLQNVFEKNDELHPVHIARIVMLRFDFLDSGKDSFIVVVKD